MGVTVYAAKDRFNASTGMAELAPVFSQAVGANAEGERGDLYCLDAPVEDMVWANGLDQAHEIFAEVGVRLYDGVGCVDIRAACGAFEAWMAAHKDVSVPMCTQPLVSVNVAVEALWRVAVRGRSVGATHLVIS